MNAYIALTIAIIAEVVATSALKASNSFTSIVPTAIVVVGYATAFYFLSVTLKTMPMGIAYAMWAGLGIVLIALAGFVFYQQKIDMAGMIGMALIIAGVVVTNVFSNTSAH